jgi:undecaprenyl-diphosphatase
MALRDNPPVNGPDLRTVRAARRLAEQPAVAAAGRALSWSGEHGAVWLVAGLTGAALDRDGRGVWLRSTAVVAGAHLASMGVKRLVRSPRLQLPNDLEPPAANAEQHSFPSSPPTSSAASVIAFQGLPPTAPTALFASAVCASRVSVGVHYPSDVLAGPGLG